MELVKTVRGYTQFAKLLAQFDKDENDLPIIVREIMRPNDFPAPYSYSPTIPVYRWNEREVVTAETDHLVYKVYQLD